MLKSIHQTYQINTTLKKVWDALINPKTIEKWGGGPVKMTDKEGEEFSLWGGDIHGTNLEVEPDKKLVQAWYGGDWDIPSKVTFNLKEKGEGVEVELIHENVPENDAEDIDDGWQQFYLGSIKRFLEQSPF